MTTTTQTADEIHLHGMSVTGPFDAMPLTTFMGWSRDQIADLQERHDAEMRAAGHEIGDLQCAVADGVEREEAQSRVIWWWKVGFFGALTVAGCVVLAVMGAGGN